MKTPTLLSHVRALNPGHLLMFSTTSLDASSELRPVVVREEPLRGLNATMKTPEDKKNQAVLQVVETAELSAGDDTLVLKGKLLVRNTILAPHSCNETGYADKHKATVLAAADKGLVNVLAQRYALNVASANWAWRNTLEADGVQVAVRWTEDGQRQEAIFIDLMLSTSDTFNLDEPQYAVHKEGVLRLADAIERALLRTEGFGTNFSIEARLHMGIGARVYPSQEWAAADVKKASKARWPGGEGVTRILAKLANGDSSQAIINDRKAGNALRIVDTWYSKATPGTPIAVEPYGANSHQGVAFRGKVDDSVFGMVKAICEDKEMTDNMLLFYVASCVRGGVYGGKDE